jgi:hypothetical protein
MIDQQVQCSIEDGRDIAIRDRMASKHLRTPQRFVRLLCQRHLQHVAFRCKRIQDGHTTDDCLDRRRRVHRCNQLLNLLLALVACRLEQTLVILTGQLGREHAHGRERHVTALESLEHSWKAPRRPSRLDSVIRRAFRQMEHLRAVSEE